MALFLIRAGEHGEDEQLFLEENTIYLAWAAGIVEDLKAFGGYEGIKNRMLEFYDKDNPKSIITGAGQVNNFVFSMSVGDYLVMPLKHKASVAVGVIQSDYIFLPEKTDDYRHCRKVKWLNKDVPRSTFDQDMLYSFGAFLTVCRIVKNDAENRLKAIEKNGWKKLSSPFLPLGGSKNDYLEKMVDLETLANDQLYALVEQRFKGHAMEILVEAVLKAQGYYTWRTTGGSDGNMDILAATDRLGFGTPRICVQVKSQDTPVDRPTLDQLQGGMHRSQATHGLLVAWGGVTNAVEKELPRLFFSVRIWRKEDLIAQLLSVYEKLDEDIRTQLPLKRVWMVARNEDE